MTVEALGSILSVLVVSILTSGFLTAGVKRLAHRLGIVAKQSPRRRHARATPLLGGSVFYIILSCVCFSSMEESPTIIYFFIASSLVFFIGILDDCIELKAFPKILVQLTASVLVVMKSDLYLSPPFWEVSIPAWVAIPLLVSWMMGVTNALNLIDGLDGLCAGIVGISCFTLAGIATLNNNDSGSFALILSIALGGACIGFLIHNFHPAKIFLGDSGSLLLGFVLAFISIKLGIKRSAAVSLSIPLMVFALPLVDVLLSIIRRRRLLRPIFQGDRSHIHHRLQQIGLSHRKAVVVLWICAVYINLSAFFLAQIPPQYSAAIYATILPMIALGLLVLYFMERRLAIQAVRFSHLFVKQEDHILRDRQRLVGYLHTLSQERFEKPLTFTLMLQDCTDLMVELTLEKPQRLIDFYVNLYGIFKSRLRHTDFIARLDDHRFVAVLAGTISSAGLLNAEKESTERGLINEISKKIRDLQEGYSIFLSHPSQPEGFRVYQFPHDAKKIWRVLRVTPQEVAQDYPERRAA